jgi:hypothetical protein
LFEAPKEEIPEPEWEESAVFSNSMSSFTLPQAAYGLGTGTGNIDVQTALDKLDLNRDGPAEAHGSTNSLTSLRTEEAPFSSQVSPEVSYSMLSTIEETGEESNYMLMKNASPVKKKVQYRLSIPPSLKLRPSLTNGNQTVFSIPREDSSSSVIDRPAFVCPPSDAWRQRTPSPVQNMRKGLSTPPMSSKKDGKKSVAYEWGNNGEVSFRYFRD